MEDKKNKVKLYPSSTGFAWGSLAITDSQNACFRYIQLARGVFTDIDPTYKIVGDLHESRYEQQLISDGVTYNRELPFKWYLSDDAYISGRMDFKLSDKIVEMKSTLSASVQTALNKGFYKKVHLAQLVTYLGAEGYDTGELNYGYYGKYQDEWTLIKGWVFGVKLDEHGRIFVDGRQTDFNAQDVVNHVVKAAEYIQSDEIAPRPMGGGSFQGPCMFCALNQLCDAYDAKQVSKTLMRDTAKEVLAEKPMHEPKISEIKRRPKETK